MSRILEVSHQAAPRRDVDVRSPQAPHVAVPASEEAAAEDSGVPFIEVGATPAQAAHRPTRGRMPTPAIIPMPRLAVRPEPTRTTSADELTLFRISFQPLPFPDHPGGPPEGRFARELVAFHRPEHEISEQYRKLMADLEAQLGTDPSKALVFTAGLPGAGTTSVLLNLAVTCARRDGTRVVVVDANFERSAVAQRLGLAPAPGLREVLARTVPLAWGLRETGQPNLSVLPAGMLVGAPAMDLWPIVLDQLRHRFDWVLIDAAGGDRPEWSALAGTASAAYLVLRQADLDKPELNEMLIDMTRLSGRLRGYVVTQQ